MTTRVNTRKITTMGVLSAISVVLVMALRIPFPAAPFLEYDPADIPIIIGTLMYGPVAGIVITIISSAIQALTVSSASGLYGFLMHIVATGSMVLIIGIINKTGKSSIFRLALALIAGSIGMTIVMVGFNLIITPLFMGVPRKQVLDMIIPIIVPFNLLKAGVNSVVSFALHKSLEKIGV